MSLFQKTIIQKYIADADHSIIEGAYTIYKSYFLNYTIQQNIIAQKEEQFQEGFLRELFVKVLNYTINPEPDFNLTTELKNEKDSKKADGAIIDKNKVIAVIELKGTDTTNLNKVEQQAFNYKVNQDGCRYVITSNFQKLRLYIDNAIEHIEWDLFNLTLEDFKILYICLQKDYLLKDIPAQMKKASVVQEEDITKKLYKEYSAFRRNLFQDIAENNPEFDKLQLFKKTQKLLDRFLFLFFAEDRLLLPPNSVRIILQQWQNLKKEYDIYQPLYDRFKKYFEYLNTGYKNEQLEIFAYNGGLFLPDDILDNIKISDATLFSGTENLSKYDFNTEVDVNILGHIFENSLSEIEEIENELNNIQSDKTTKRKKDGVFYTPKYITKYIVENTAGALCREKKDELKIIEEDYHPLQNKKNKKELLDTLTKYRDWLLHITIVDPACGSGAFLNQALEFLIEEHKYISELEAKLTGSQIVFDVETSILENNIFGVDLNEESVEIAKLSLWLRTAQVGRKLNSLNNNIKCGNSLIDDISIAGDKAFNWQQEFPQIFANGGFDVVIGNPPYVRVEFISENMVNYFKNNYKSATSKFDLSSLFFEKSIELINKKGIYSIITSYQFLYASSGIGLRNFIAKHTSCEIIKFTSDTQIFTGATTYAGIFIAKKIKSDKILICDANNNFQSVNIYKKFSISADKFCIEKVMFDDNNILEKIENNTNVILGSKIGMAKTGVVTSADDIFFINPAKAKELNLENNIVYPIIGSDELESWILKEPETLCIYPYEEIENKTSLLPINKLKDTYINIYRYLIDNKPKLILRSQGRKDYSESEKWYQLNRPREKWIYDSIKIIYPGTTNKPKFALDNEKKLFRNARVYAYLLKKEFNSLYKVILPILNSRLTKYLISLKCPPKANNYFEMSTGFMESYPFIIPEDNIKTIFIQMADIMIAKKIELQTIKGNLIKLIQSNFNGLNITKKIENWNELDFGQFLKELEKQKIKLSLPQQAEWMHYFNTEKQKANDIQHTISQTDKEIDQLVYKLYELTEEEIKIVEGV